MSTVSLKLSDPLATQLTDTARRRGISKSALIRDALQLYLQSSHEARPGSALSEVVDLAGILSGPEDLSVNRNYLRNFGR